MNVWSGRVDEGALRWHQVVRFGEPNQRSIVLLGLSSDEGVRRNQGRVGAAQGPMEIRRAMANLPAHLNLDLVDFGDVECDGEELELAVAEYAQLGSELLQSGALMVGLGGGHEIAWATYSAVRKAHPEKTIGILNIDAHLDLRKSLRMTSGTPFRQALEDLSGKNRYAAFGISRASNTEDLFDAARLNKVWVVMDSQLKPWDLSDLLERLRSWLSGCHQIYLSIDLDALPASVCPGVSAPAARGIGFDVIEPILNMVAGSKKLAAVDIAELNPLYDIDGRTAKVAARLIHTIVERRLKLTSSLVMIQEYD